MIKRMNLLIPTPFKKWCYNLSGFNKLGLWIDDMVYEDEDVKEALRRLPQKIKDERNFRIVRAMQLDACKRILPKEQWTKYEDDIPYLWPYINRVIRERKERERWEAEN